MTEYDSGIFVVIGHYDNSFKMAVIHSAMYFITEKHHWKFYGFIIADSRETTENEGRETELGKAGLKLGTLRFMVSTLTSRPPGCPMYKQLNTNQTHASVVVIMVISNNFLYHIFI